MPQAARPLVTIGIPTFNRPEGLAHTLSRATNQTYGNLDILISDNASVDEAAVRAVIERYHGDARVRYVRQPSNIGSLGNFPFLAHQALGEYFLWMSDDDDVELNYVEALVTKLSGNPKATIVMGGYDIEDQMSQPVIRLNLTEHLRAMSGATAIDRMTAYLHQPDHLAKSRLNWGMFPTALVRRAFDECARHIEPGQKPLWADFPIDLRMLSYGDLALDPRVLWHVKLLPTSDGKSTLGGDYKKLAELSRHTERSFCNVVEDSTLEPSQKKTLQRFIRRRAKRDKIELFIYYKIISQSPQLARWVKKIWYKVFS